MTFGSDQVRNQFFGLTTSGSISNDDHLASVLANQRRQFRFGLLLLFIRQKIHDINHDDATDFVEYGELAPCTKSWINGKHPLAMKWRLQEQVPQILCKNRNRMPFCFFGQIAAKFSIECRLNKPSERVGCAGHDELSAAMSRDFQMV